MASNGNDSDTGAGKTGETSARPKSQPPTIDLKAEEVADAKSDDAPPATEETGAVAEDDTPKDAAAETETDSSADKPGKWDESSAKYADSAAMAVGDNPPSSGGSSFGLIAAALIGGVVGAALIYALTLFGALPSGGSDDATGTEIAALKQSLADVEAKVANPPAPDMSGIEAGIAELKSEVETLKSSSSAAGADQGALDALSAKIDALEATAASAAPADDALTGRLDTLETQAQGLASDVGTLKSEIQTLSTTAGSAEPVDLSGIESRLSAVENAEAGVGEQIAMAIAAIPVPDLSGVQSTQTELAGKVGGLDEKVSTLETTIGALASKVDGLSGEIDGLKSNTTALDDERRSAYLVALSGLQRAAEDSGPFEAELKAVKDLAGDDTAFDALDLYAATGVPSQADLTRRFADLTGTILDAAAKASANSVMGRLAAGAQSLVRIRPTGFVEGDSPAATVARIESLLGNGKLSAALDEWKKLPEAAQAASSNWADDAQKRLALNDALSGQTATN